MSGPDETTFSWYAIVGIPAVSAAVLLALWWLGALRRKGRARWPLLIAFAASCIVALADAWFELMPPLAGYLRKIELDLDFTFGATGYFLSELIQFSGPFSERALLAVVAMAVAVALNWRTLRRRPALVVAIAFAVEIGLIAVQAPVFWQPDEGVVAAPLVALYVIYAPIQLLAAFLAGVFAYRALIGPWPLLWLLSFVVCPLVVRVLPFATAGAFIEVHGLATGSYTEVVYWGLAVGVFVWGGFILALVWLRFPTRYLVHRRLGRRMQRSAVSAA